MKQRDHKSTLWLIWALLTGYYIYIPYQSEEPYFSFGRENFEWHWVLNLTVFNFVASVVFWLIARSKGNDAKKMLGYYIAGLAFANAPAYYSSYLVLPHNDATEFVVWIIGFLATILFLPSLVTKKSNNKGSIRACST